MRAHSMRKSNQTFQVIKLGVRLEVFLESTTPPALAKVFGDANAVQTCDLFAVANLLVPKFGGKEWHMGPQRNLVRLCKISVVSWIKIVTTTTTIIIIIRQG